MRILVTGGAGFIGSNFVRRSLEGAYPATRDAEIVVLDRLSYAGSLHNLAPVRDHPRFVFQHGDIRNPDDVHEVMGGVSAVVHFAAETHVDRSLANSSEFVETNVTGTHVLLRAALKAGVARFVLVSTDEVYGSVSSGAWTEHSLIQPNSPYAASKAAAEHLGRAFFHAHGLPVCSVRASNTYGPYQHPEKLIPLCITNLLEGLAVPLYGDGMHIREWMHVDDHCRGIARVLEDGHPGEVYNVGSGHWVTNRAITGQILTLIGADWSRVRYVSDRKGHDRRYALDSTKISTELGHRASVSVEDGLLRTVTWYMTNRQWWAPLRAAHAQ